MFFALSLLLSAALIAVLIPPVIRYSWAHGLIATSSQETAFKVTGIVVALVFAVAGIGLLVFGLLQLLGVVGPS